MKRSIAAAALLVALACREQPKPSATADAPTAGPAATDHERTNLLNIAYGGSVVSRTAELTLDHSAVRAIDGDPASGWASPPQDTEQSIVFSLPAPARIEKLGILSFVAPETRLKSITLETSEDGRNFTTVATPSPETKPQLQLFDIKPVISAQYLRVTTGPTGSTYAGFAAIHVAGSLLREPSVAPLEGCWTINGFPSSIVSRDGRVTGVLRAWTPIHFEGSADGAVYRLTWSRGPEIGVALVTLSPDGRNLTGAKWYEEPIPLFYGDSWLGERGGSCEKDERFESSLRGWIRKRGHYPLYTLQFDRGDALVGNAAGRAAVAAINEAMQRAGTHRIRIASREFREANPQANLRRSQLRLESLRAALAKQDVDVSKIDFQASGSERPHSAIVTESMRVLYSVIDIEVPEAARSLF